MPTEIQSVIAVDSYASELFRPADTDGGRPAVILNPEGDVVDRLCWVAGQMAMLQDLLECSDLSEEVMARQCLHQLQQISPVIEASLRALARTQPSQGASLPRGGS